MAATAEVMAEVRDGVEAPSFLERLAARVGATADASAVFGDPVERGDVTVIPVARAAWGFGGGSGGSGAETGSGGGGGGAVMAVGYIEVRDGGAEFKPVRDPRRAIVLGAGLIALATLLGRRA